MSALLERIDRPGPKRLLSLDGGGIRGLIAIEVLEAIETRLRAQLGAGDDWVLADWFDYIAGTSTGAIIAAGLALGMRVSEIRRFYHEQGAAMFGPARLVNRFRYKFESEPLAAALRSAFGAQRTLGSPDLRSLLLVVLRNATTDSPWPLSNNPRARYNDEALSDCNLRLPLWQIIRASTAAPTFFPPEIVDVGGTRFEFEDGGITPYNNPAFLLFLMATTAPYRVSWATGADKLLLVSIGTGSVPNDRAALSPKGMSLLYAAGAVPRAVMFGASNQQDMMCRMFANTLAGPSIDGEVGDLTDGSGLPKLLSYVRYNADLTSSGLGGLGLHGMKPRDVQRMDGVRFVSELEAIGQAVARSQVRAEHFIAGGS